ncbi:hypothetical protein H257_02787 [Aphanomyces astaci]|uniref:BTB domain-containing protein n=1 Tax=Aphanomyces astaci TaxID=112090 RepID=W4H482_APHAT|nr:hypothetical protein H257_02787 [Aphanomyces astaci]ETV86416.1 hypothetical protein H257_02787 [Aphanomyces astaci]RQM19066.1 hypothetical protein B5M09_008140 [Aphanomyces astaci]|eukprot:XP_009824888.1 hypothetical protein H257_02787 [Aphanomyces astaci]
MTTLRKETVQRSLSGSLDMLKLFSADFMETSQAIKDQLDVLERKEQAWRELQLRIQRNTVAAADAITLDVGGVVFKTSKQTLLRVEGTYFHAMLGAGCWQPDGPANSYFLDLDPTHFDRVMTYLRTSELSFDGLSAWECRQLRSTLDYLNILTPRDLAMSKPTPPLIQWNPHACSSSLVLLHDQRTVQKAAGAGRSVSNAVVGTTPVDVFSLRLDEFPATGNVLGKIFVGLAPSKGFGVYSYNPDRCGYYVELRHGSVFGQDGTTGKPYATGFKTGDVVTVRRCHRQIHFEKNDQELGVAFELGHDEGQQDLLLFPVVSMYYHGATLTLVPSPPKCTNAAGQL